VSLFGSERSLRSLSPPNAGWSLAGPTPALAVSAECGSSLALPSPLCRSSLALASARPSLALPSRQG